MPSAFLHKSLLAALWLLPSLALTGFSVNRWQPEASTAKAAPLPMKVPIEVISANEPPKFVYIEFDSTTVPEPSTLLLLPASALLLFRRRR